MIIKGRPPGDGVGGTVGSVRKDPADRGMVALLWTIVHSNLHTCGIIALAPPLAPIFPTRLDGAIVLHRFEEVRRYSHRCFR
ncbi:hypothetical protein Q1695_001382 [Nippostrongylus brasiliensis]|nr:hypothetical protein Q1695_001382 [Nippostrongylus brasiliensis]